MLYRGFHEQVLRRVGRFILSLLLLFPAIAARGLEALLARRRDAWENVTHLFLF
jgi:hypothetical protein